MNAPPDESACYKFDDLELDAGRRRLRRGGSDIELPKLSFDLLLALADAAPDALSTDDLMDRAWSGAVVSPGTIAKRVELLRQALGDDSAKPRYVALVRGHGYRLIPAVTRTSRDRGAAYRRATAAAVVAAAALIIVVSAISTRIPGVRPPERSVAVLPFKSYSVEDEFEFLADGLTAEIIHALARVPKLKVTGRTSSFTFKDRNEDLRSIGEALGVAHVLEGTVRSSGDRLRVTAQLVTTADGFLRWSESYDRRATDILEIQEDITRNVVDALRVEMLGQPSKVGPNREVDPEAYALYLRAAGLSSYRWATGLAEAQSLLERALELDPDFAPAWNRLAAIHGRRLFGRDPTYTIPPAKAMVIIMEAVDRGRELNPNDAEVYANLAGIAWIFERDAAKAAPLIERALELNPSDIDIVRFSIDFASSLGRYDQAIALSERVVDREPLCVPCRAQLARLYMFARRWNESEEQLRILQVMGEDRIHWRLGVVQLHTGRPDEALASFENHDGPDYQRLQGRAMALHDLGRADESTAALAALAESWGDERPLELAQAYAYVGQSDKAFDVLYEALPEYTAMLQTELAEPLFRKLHADPRWAELLTRIDRAPEQVEHISFSLP